MIVRIAIFRMNIYRIGIFLLIFILAACNGGGGSENPASDTTPPAVTSTTPSNDATGVEINTDITATFNERLEELSVNNTSFTLVGSAAIAGTVNYAYTSVSQYKIATFIPGRNLAYATLYTATLSGEVKDEAGNRLTTSYSWAFTTKPKPIFSDTGISSDQCYEAGTDILVACNSANAIALNPEQDGMTGRDADISTNSSTDGHLGFSFKQVCNSGELAGTGACPASSALGSTTNVWGCTQDNVSGLMWENKSAINMTVKYTNFDNTSLYQIDSSIQPTQAEIDAASNSVGFMNAANISNLCGHNDWRIPTANELLSIVDYSSTPFIDTNWFPNTQSGKYKSVSPLGGDQGMTWFVDFGEGGVKDDPRSTADYLRLVRTVN